MKGSRASLKKEWQGTLGREKRACRDELCEELCGKFVGRMGVKIQATENNVRDWERLGESQLSSGLCALQRILVKTSKACLFVCLIMDSGLLSPECDAVLSYKAALLYLDYGLRIKSHSYYFLPVLLCTECVPIPSQLNTAFVRS